MSQQKPTAERHEVNHETVQVWLVNDEKSMMVSEFTGESRDVASGHSASNLQSALDEGHKMEVVERPEAGNWIALLGRWAFKVGTRDECETFAREFNRTAEVIVPPIITGPGWYKLRNGGWTLNPKVIYRGGNNSLAPDPGETYGFSWYNVFGNFDTGSKKTGLDIVRAATTAEAQALNAMNEGNAFTINWTELDVKIIPDDYTIVHASDNPPIAPERAA